MLRDCVGVALVGWLVAAPVRAAPGEDADVGPAPAGPAPVAEGPAPPPVAVTKTTRLPAVEVLTAKRVRHDWYAAAAFGLGGGNLRPADSGDGSRGAGALVLLLRGGGRIGDRVAIGGVGVTAVGGGGGGARGLSNLMAEALFFPVKDRGLGVAVAIGLSSTYGGRAKTGTTAAEVEAVRGGVGFGLGLGYDFWLARRFNIGVWARADGSAGPVYKLRAAGSLGLAFSFY